MFREWRPEQLEAWPWLKCVTEDHVERLWRMSHREEPPAHLDTPCYIFDGCVSRGGGAGTLPYGTLHVGEHRVRTHVFSCLVLGEHSLFTPGHHVDHVCQRTLCVAPEHLEAVPGEVNLFRRWRRT